MPASIAAGALRTFPDRNARAHQAADKILAALDAGGRIKVRRNPQASNIVMLHLSQDRSRRAVGARPPGGHSRCCMARRRDAVLC